MANVPAVADACMVPDDDHGALVIVVRVPPVRMLWFPEVVAVADPCVLVPDRVVLMLAFPVSVGVCEAFIPNPKAGVVPAVML